MSQWVCRWQHHLSIPESPRSCYCKPSHLLRPINTITTEVCIPSRILSPLFLSFCYSPRIHCHSLITPYILSFTFLSCITMPYKFPGFIASGSWQIFLEQCWSVGRLNHATIPLVLIIFDMEMFNIQFLQWI